VRRGGSWIREAEEAHWRLAIDALAVDLVGEVLAALVAIDRLSGMQRLLGFGGSLSLSRSSLHRSFWECYMIVDRSTRQARRR
jgi:hypothetical protein